MLAAMSGSRGVVLGIACLAAVLRAELRVDAYEERVHALIEERALPPEILATPLVPATLDDADALRVALWHAGAEHPDVAVKRAFLSRYPSVDAFDRWAFKELLGLTPEAQIFGVDRLPAMPAHLGELVAQGAREPDDDKRNQERFSHDAARHPRVDRWGNPLPLDPAQLDMGPLRGIPSQAYAHYGLPSGERSDSTDVLKKEPWRWAYPPTARGFAPEFAQELTDLAICAATLARDGDALRRPDLARSGAVTLGWLYLAQADHYIGDVANQIHTLQAIYPFFFDAKMESYKEELRSMGGLFRARPDFVTIGIGIIKNHHLLAEDLWAKRVLAGGPDVAAGLEAIRTGDAALEQALDARKVGPGDEFGRAIAEEVIVAGCREGGEVYETIRELAVPELSRVGGNFDDGMDPDAFLRSAPEAGTLEKFYRLEAAGFARAGSAIRRHARLFVAALDGARTSEDTRKATFDASAQRLIRTQLALAAQAETRLSTWQPRPPPREVIDWLVPGVSAVLALGIVAITAWLIARSRRRRRRRRSTLQTSPSNSR
jgi:hypothetical protein